MCKLVFTVINLVAQWIKRIQTQFVAFENRGTCNYIRLCHTTHTRLKKLPIMIDYHHHSAPSIASRKIIIYPDSGTKTSLGETQFLGDPMFRVGHFGSWMGICFGHALIAVFAEFIGQLCPQFVLGCGLLFAVIFCFKYIVVLNKNTQYLNSHLCLTIVSQLKLIHLSTNILTIPN